jgi:HPt (histidine-containing phosphotransfer) domain-containing protein
VTEDTDIVLDAVDTTRIEAVSAAIGTQRLQELIRVLDGRVQNLARAAVVFPQSSEDFLAALHQSRGSAASLGFLALAEALARMEELGRQTTLQAESAEPDFAAACEAVRQAGRALPGLWKEAMEAQTALLF